MVLVGCAVLPSSLSALPTASEETDDIRLGCEKISNAMLERQPHLVVLITQQGLCLSNADVTIYLNENVDGWVEGRNKEIHKISANIDGANSRMLVQVWCAQINLPPASSQPTILVLSQLAGTEERRMRRSGNHGRRRHYIDPTECRRDCAAVLPSPASILRPARGACSRLQRLPVVVCKLPRQRLRITHQHGRPHQTGEGARSVGKLARQLEPQDLYYCRGRLEPAPAPLVVVRIPPRRT
mmetsp:Transcript_1766/g.3694  ORF Transcript_1766/g.3694 Transcript_1766/m.3694 type:complete len:241 (-) Transcript_1766:113-835(-)